MYSPDLVNFQNPFFVQDPWNAEYGPTFAASALEPLNYNESLYTGQQSFYSSEAMPTEQQTSYFGGETSTEQQLPHYDEATDTGQKL